jgi:small Trp-rich protein
MYLLWIGLVLVVLKWLEVGPTAQWSWWWTLAPLAGAFIWFEWLERMVGRDRRKSDHIEWEQRRKDRVSKQFLQPGAKAARKS